MPGPFPAAAAPPRSGTARPASLVRRHAIPLAVDARLAREQGTGTAKTAPTVRRGGTVLPTAHREARDVERQMPVRARRQVYVSRREADRAWPLHA